MDVGKLHLKEIDFGSSEKLNSTSKE